MSADLDKDPSRLLPAYDDALGVTAAFDKNALVRLNREIGSDFDLASFRHRAHYNAMAGRIETFLVSTRDQKVRVGKQQVSFSPEEAMQVEYSCKYSPEDFAALAARAGLDVAHAWTDPEQMFAVYYLVRKGATKR